MWWYQGKVENFKPTNHCDHSEAELASWTWDTWFSTCSVIDHDRCCEIWAGATCSLRSLTAWYPKLKSYVSRVKTWPSSTHVKLELCQKSVLGQVSHPECGLCYCTESRLYSVSLLVRASGLGTPDGCWLLVTLTPLLFFFPPHVHCECAARIWQSGRTPALQTLLLSLLMFAACPPCLAPQPSLLLSQHTFYLLC